MGIWHERTRDRDRQRAGVSHLLHRFGLEALTPLTPRSEFRSRCEWWAVQCTGQRRTHFISKECSRISDDVEEFSLCLLAPHAARKETLHMSVG